MSLTPLHFHRQTVVGTHGHHKIPVHGLHRYITDCGRFILHCRKGKWRVTATTTHEMEDRWFMWLQQVGLNYSASFTTRRDLIEAIADALIADGLLNVDDPTAAIAFA